MTQFTDLPNELIVLILQQVETVYPPSQLRTNRIFYDILKPIFYSNITVDLLENTRRMDVFEDAIENHPSLLSSLTNFTLPFDMRGRMPFHVRNIDEELHGLFSLTRCKNLELAIQSEFREPTLSQIPSLISVTNLTLKNMVPGNDGWVGGISISAQQFDAWIKHMPRLTGLYIEHPEGVSVEGLRHLPNTLVRLELLGEGDWKALTLADLRTILNNLPSLRHFLLSETPAPLSEIASCIRECLPACPSTGIGFPHAGDKYEMRYERKWPIWEKDVAELLRRPYTVLTFYFITNLPVFIDNLATSPCAVSLRKLQLKSPIKPAVMLRSSDTATRVNSMYKLLDRNIFPNLITVSGSRIQEQLKNLKAWDAFSEKAAAVGVGLFVEDW